MQKEVLFDRKIMDMFPKVELHRHIEGSFCLDTLFELAIKNNIPNTARDLREFKSRAQFPKDHKPDFKLFLSLFRNDWYSSHEDVYKVVYNSVKQFKNENLFFIELRFSPEHFAFKNNFNRIETTKIIIEAAKKAANEIGLYISFLITFNRNRQTEPEMLELYNNIKKAGLTEIRGMDLAGDEILNPPEEFIKLFDAIYRDELGVTVHAGEVTEPEQIWAAINLLHAKRIGHGTSAIADRKLQEELINRKIYLEQCPVSNYFTGSFIDTSKHPFKELHNKGVLVTLNSDDPTIQNTTLTDDYFAALKYFDIDYQGLINLNIRSLEGSFSLDKKELIKKYKDSVKKFEEQARRLMPEVQWGF